MKTALKLRSQGFSLNFRLVFRSSTADPTADPEFKKFIMEEDLEKNEELREKMHKFEREWKRLYEDQRQKDPTKPVHELSEYQKKKVEYLVQQTQKLNLLERKYFAIKIRDQLLKTTGFNPLSINAQWPDFKNIDTNPWTFIDPNDVKRQEAIAKLWPIGAPALAGLFTGVGFGQGRPQTSTAQTEESEGAQETKEKKEEEQEEKKNFDIELESFDAAQKIKIIKEIREIFKLGLKEAKDMVEKAPISLKSHVPKEEAEKIIERLTNSGCKVSLK